MKSFKQFLGEDDRSPLAKAIANKVDAQVNYMKGAHARGDDPRDIRKSLSKAHPHLLRGAHAALKDHPELRAHIEHEAKKQNVKL